MASGSVMTISTFILFSSCGIQAIASLASFIAILKIRDPSLVKMFKIYPISISTIMVLSLMDSNLLLLTVSQLMGMECFKIKYTSEYS
jgi:hypothetical protein